MCHNFSVKIHSSNHCQRSHWLKKPILSGKYRHWLIDNGSLTLRLQQLYPDFKVKPTLVTYAKPTMDEAATLSASPRNAAMIREVLLMGNNQAVVFAHSVLPRKSLRGYWLGLGRLGNKPLGATLFANPQVRRTPLSYKKLSPLHALYQQAAKFLIDPPPYLWARRSVFTLNYAKIMVTEVFLPQISAT
jgi:chorismate--pyruvate lyase